MDNFLTFIEKDIEAKKLLISSLPKKTKTNKKNYNENLDEITNKYKAYKKSVRNYLLAKCRSYNLKEDEKDNSKLLNKITSLQQIKFILNPTNTYFEKMGFDSILYKLNNYYTYDFNFGDLTEIITEFIDKFKLIDITLSPSDFEYTCYVNEFMIKYFEKNYDNLSEAFEQIYWYDPDILQQIELNFRKLIKDNEKKFLNYILKLQKETMVNNNIPSYNECILKLKDSCEKLEEINVEDIYDIVKSAISLEFDVNTYLEGSKVRSLAYDSLIGYSVDKNDKESMKKIYKSLEKLKLNINEYSNYLKFLPIINDFKDEYQKLIPNQESKKNNQPNSLREISIKIDNKEKQLKRTNKKIFNKKTSIFNKNNGSTSKEAKILSIQISKDIYELYKEYDKEYFNSKVISLLSETMTLNDVLNIYYSFDFYKKNKFKKIFNLTSYNDVIKLSDDFDIFAIDPTNIIINSASLFEDNDLAKIIINKYKLDNVIISEEDLGEDNLKLLLNKVLLILRINIIENSETSLDKIWFMVEVSKIIEKEEREKNELKE